MNADTSFLTTKKLVYHSGVPVPFAIYEGMVESIYMLNSSVAYTSICSPGFYKMWRDFVSALDGPLSIVDDVLGLCVLPDKKDSEKSIHYSVTQRSVIEQLTSLNRIQWKCPHVEGPAKVLDTGTVWVANPLAYMQYHRVHEINAQVVNEHPNTTFIIPAGTGEKARICLNFFLNHVKRNILFCRVPCALIDDCTIVIPAKELKTVPQIKGLTIEPAHRLYRGTAAWSAETERSVFQHLYG